MTMGGIPYITQINIQEAERAGGIDRVILGGQGETAEAAHEAMSSFPDCKAGTYDDADELAAFVQQHFHMTSADLSRIKLAGFVGMHTQDGEITRDVKNFGLLSKDVDRKKIINTAIVTNTPHMFIRGGYKSKTTTWDGKRIDDFAAFLVSIGVDRVADDNKAAGKETLTPKERPDAKKIDLKDDLTGPQKHALEVAKQKKLDAEARAKILVRIEADKVTRKLRKAREQESRLHAANGPQTQFTPSVNRLGGGSGRPESQGQSSATQSCEGEYPDVEEPYSDPEFDWDDFAVAPAPKKEKSKRKKALRPANKEHITRDMVPDQEDALPGRHP